MLRMHKCKVNRVLKKSCNNFAQYLTQSCFTLTYVPDEAVITHVDELLKLILYKEHGIA